MWDSLGFLDLGGYFLPHFSDSFSLLSPEIFFHSLSFCLLLLDTFDLNVGAFNIMPEISEAVLISFYSFFFFHTASFISPFHLPAHLSFLLPYSVTLLLVPYGVFLISVNTLFITG